jgi:nitrite reductase (NO-forming)
MEVRLMSDHPTPGPARTNDTMWWVVSTTLGVIALLIGAIALFTPRGGTATADDTDAQVEFAIELGDIWVKPAAIEVPSGQMITLDVVNNGVMVHDLKVLGVTGTDMLDPGESATVQIGPFTSDTEAWCTVPGHKEAGMTLAITVAAATPAPAAPNGTGDGTGAPDGPAAASIDAQAMPDDDYTARDAVLPPAPGAKVHELTMVASEEMIEVAPGVTQEMWVFDGQVPGPTLRGKVGDTFRITLRNDGQVGHSIDFHASMVAWDDEMRTIGNGEELVYEFTAEFAGAYMYHCGTAPALHHIGNGMYGAIVIDPPELPTVDEEFLLVQGELYLGPDGKPGDLTKMIDEQWDAVVFNGYHNQYTHRPLHVEVDTRYRVWVLDAGPNENSAFHIVGTVFDTVWKEGAYLLRPDDTRGGSQVLDLQPAQGGFVEFTFAEDGLYPIVTHKFANVGKGALGFFAVGDADTTALGGH